LSRSHEVILLSSTVAPFSQHDRSTATQDQNPFSLGPSFVGPLASYEVRSFHSLQSDAVEGWAVLVRNAFQSARYIYIGNPEWVQKHRLPRPRLHSKHVRANPPHVRLAHSCDSSLSLELVHVCRCPAGRLCLHNQHRLSRQRLIQLKQ
jgi:hypothetical protein